MSRVCLGILNQMRLFVRRYSGHSELAAMTQVQAQSNNGSSCGMDHGASGQKYIRLAGLSEPELFAEHHSGCIGGSTTLTPSFKVPYGSSWDVGTLCKEGRLKEAVHILNIMDQQGIKASLYTYVCLLQLCINMKALTEGKLVHTHILKSGIRPNVLLGSSLANMYFKCGSVVDARQVFDKMPERNVVTWTIMIAGYAQHGLGEEALELFQQMEQEGVKPDKFTFVSVLKACASVAALEQGTWIHAQIIKCGLESDVFVGSTLLHMYAKCGSIEHARQVFDKMPKRNVVSWNAMIAGYAQHRQALEAFELFQQMEREGVKPNEITFVSLLKACAIIMALEQGKQIHAYLVKCGLDSDIIVGNSLVSMYAKCGSIKYAHQVFNKMPRRNVRSFNTMLAGYAEHGCNKLALSLVRQMEQEGIKPNQVTFVSLLKACSSIADLKQGKKLHAHIIKSGFELDVFVANTLIDMYAKCGSIECAHQVFDRMPERNVVSWNTIIAGYAQHGQGAEALELFEQMKLGDLRPNEVTFSTILKACTSITALEQGKQIHAQIIKSGFESDIFVRSALVDMYAKCSNIEHARQIFDKMPHSDIVLWNTMLAGYVQHGLGGKAVELFLQMEGEGVKPDEATFVSILKACASVTGLEYGKQVHACIIKSGFESSLSVGNTLVDMYAKCGSIGHARRVFDEMPKRDVVSWTAMIAGYSQHGQGQKALELFQQMERESLKPDRVTFVSILHACASIAALEQGKQIHASIIKRGFESDIFVGSTLIDMYAKCGSIEHARQVFDKMCKRNVVAWTSMIAGYAQHGQGKEALELFWQMEQVGVKPDEVTFASILKSCASVTALKQGKEIHTQIIESGFDSNVFLGNSLIDMYSKCGNIEDARQVFDNMPKRNVVSWNAIIAGYAQHGHGKEALQLVKQMREERTKPNHITFVAILSACSHAGLVDEGHGYFDSMSRDHDITPTSEHYACMVDLLGRAGYLQEAEDLIKRMPMKPNAIVWTTLLGACRVHGNAEIAKHAAACILQFEPQNTGAVVLLSNIYAAAGRWYDKTKVRTLMEEMEEKNNEGTATSK